MIYEKILRKMAPLFDPKNDELHKKFPAFHRDDKKYFKKRLWNYFGLATWLPRFAITVFGWLFCGVCAKILLIDLDKDGSCTLKKDKNGNH